MTDGPRTMVASAWRFAIAGGARTLATLVAMTLLVHVIQPWIAYTLVYAAGVAMAVWLAGDFTFGVRLTRKLAVAYAAMYIAVYFVGVAAVEGARALGMPDEWSGLVVLVTAPLTFVGGRLLLVRPSASPAPAERIGT